MMRTNISKMESRSYSLCNATKEIILILVWSVFTHVVEAA